MILCISYRDQKVAAPDERLQKKDDKYPENRDSLMTGCYPVQFGVMDWQIGFDVLRVGCTRAFFYLPAAVPRSSPFSASRVPIALSRFTVVSAQLCASSSAFNSAPIRMI